MGDDRKDSFGTFGARLLAAIDDFDTEPRRTGGTRSSFFVKNRTAVPLSKKEKLRVTPSLRGSVSESSLAATEDASCGEVRIA